MAEKLQKRALVTRAKILAAAVKAFAEKGFDGTTVDDIASAAGVNKQRLYAYYGSKRKLFEAALLEVFLQVRLLSASALEEAERNPAELSRITLESFLHIHESQPALWRLLAWANLEGGDCVDVLECARKDENDVLRKIFDRAVAAGLIKPVKFEIWLFTMLGISCFYYSNRQSLRHTLDRDIVSSEWKSDLIKNISSTFSPSK